MPKLATSLLLLTLAVVWPTYVSAASATCRQLESQLSDKAATRFSADKYDAAIDRQREQLAVMNDQKDEAGCNYSIGGRNIRQCAVINKTIEKMSRNLATLQRDRKRASGAAPNKRDRTRILAALEANNCRDSDDEERAVSPQAVPNGLEEATAAAGKSQLQIMLDQHQLRTNSGEQMDGFGGSRDEDIADQEQDAHYRTMCVRTCDGYFFPMSNASTVSDFDRDQQNCETACPGTDMRVFYGPMDTDDPSRMMSTGDGLPYGSLPTAFRHQNASLPRVPACGCNATKDFEVTAGASGVRPAAPADATGEGTKAIENEKSSSIVTVAPIEPPAPPAHKQLDTVGSQDETVEHDAPPRNVRVVGPEFLPDPKAAIDLRAPAQRNAP